MANIPFLSSILQESFERHAHSVLAAIYLACPSTFLLTLLISQFFITASLCFYYSIKLPPLMQNFIQRGRAFIMTTSIDLESVNPHRSIIITPSCSSNFLRKATWLTECFFVCEKKQSICTVCRMLKRAIILQANCYSSATTPHHLYTIPNSPYTKLI